MGTPQSKLRINSQMIQYSDNRAISIRFGLGEYLMAQVLINKMSKKRNGFINLLFEDLDSSERKQEPALKEVDMKRIQKFMQENVFMPRNRLKYTRILRIDDSVCLSQQKNSIHKHLKKMFVDGSQLREVLPRRQLISQNYSRTIECQRLYSPEINNKRRSLNQAAYAQDFSINTSRQVELPFPLSQIYPEDIVMPVYMRPEDNQSFLNVSTERNDEFLSLDNSTDCSSHKHIRKGTSIRYRKILHSDKKQGKNPKAVLELKKQLAKFYSNPFGNPENITAKAYIVVEHFRQKKNQRSLHAAQNSKINLQIASLTKIMTCILAIELCQKHNISIATQQVYIGTFETRIEGTVAQLQPGQIYTVQQLLYGLMLPSGNDASIALSIFCGQLLQKNKEQAKRIDCQSQINQRKYYYKKFLLQMNKKCHELDMKRTFFSNSHGLPNQLNKSCASDLAILIDYALTNPLFRIIIKTPCFECEVKQPYRKKDKEKSILAQSYGKKKVKWENTHRLVQTKPDIYKGIKTGITQAAGPCLASLLEMNGRQFIVIVLNSRTLKARYKDTEALREWLSKKQDFSADFNK